MPRSSVTSRALTVSRRWWVVGQLSLALLLTGCGGKPKVETAPVSGKVTVKGAAPAPGTTIKFIGSDGNEVSTIVASDGSYTATGVAVGEAKVVVTGTTSASTAIGTGGAKSEMPGMSGGPDKGAPIAAKYGTPGTLPNYVVKSGENTPNLDLLPGPPASSSRGGGALPGMGGAGLKPGLPKK